VDPTVSGLGCPACGGSLEVREGLTNLPCRYCGTSLLVLGRRGVERLMVLDEVDRPGAEQVLRRWFDRGIRKEPALRKEAEVREAFLAWFPFVRTRCDLIGWVLGQEKRRVQEGSSWVTRYEPKEIQIEESVDSTTPAAEMAEFGVSRVNLHGDELRPLDEDTLRSRGMTFRPSHTPEEASRQALETAVTRVRSKKKLDRTTFSWTATVRNRVTVVYYPLWVVRYAFHNRQYQALIDAEDGTLAYGKAPGNHLYRAGALVSACAAAAFIATTTLQHLGLLLRFDNTLAALGAILVVLGATLAWGYSVFRHGGVVEEGTGTDARSTPTPLERIRKELE
jgi:hypothetical protein